MKTPNRPFLGALCALVGNAIAAIPGVFVVQEARIDDPAGTRTTRLGLQQMAVIGDADDNGFLDLIASAPQLDSGALHVFRLGPGGALVGTSTVNAREPRIASRLDPMIVEGFGNAVAPLTTFSRNTTCAKVLTSSRSLMRLWGLEICKDGGGLVVNSVQLLDSSSMALTGLRTIGSPSLVVLDTIRGTGERVVAMGLPQASGLTSTSREGRVILLAVDTATFATRRLTSIPANAASPLDSEPTLVAGEMFGFSVSPWHGSTGGKGMAVVSGSTGRLHLITLGAGWNPTRTVSRLQAVGKAKLASVSSADYDHDGIPDLALGFPQWKPGTGISGAALVQTLDRDGAPRDSTLLDLSTSALAGKDPVTGFGFGSQLLATDFDRDGQVDLVAGCSAGQYGDTIGPGGTLWPLRMKSAPWRLRALDTIAIDGPSSTKIVLSGYLGGNGLTWSMPPRIAMVDPVAECRLHRDTLVCTAGTLDGVTSYTVVASDTGNTPASLHLTDTLSFAIRVTGLVGPVGVGSSLTPSLRLDARARPGVVRIHGGASAFQVELLDLVGAHLGGVSGTAGQTLELDVQGRRGIVLARVREAGVVTVVPVFVGR
jgi:hypothetical protein